MGKFTDNPRATNRPLIEKKMLGRGATLDITHGGERYLVPHDELVGWVGENLNALNTISWRDKGRYSWPKAPDLMVEFIRRYQIPVS